MARTLALTGATGFIGSALARRFQIAGWRIKVLVRASSNRGRLSGIDAQPIEGDLEDLDSLRLLVRHTGAVVHCAGTVRGASPAQFNKVNIDGVARLVRAATEQQPVPRFLLLSSLAAREAKLSPYAASKRGGEEILAAEAGEMRWAAFRPPAVYGPADRELLPLFQWMARGISPVLGPEQARFSLLYVEDLAEAVLKWCESDVGSGQLFEMHDGKPGGYTWSEVADTIARLCERRVLQIKVPVAVLRVMAFLNLTAARLLGYAPILTPWKVRELIHLDWVCDNEALSRETGWRPTISLEEGLRRTIGLPCG